MSAARGYPHSFGLIGVEQISLHIGHTAAWQAFAGTVQNFALRLR